MAWSSADRKNFRRALQEVYPSYKKLEMFVDEELDEPLEAIAPSSHDMNTVTFDLMKWARINRRLDELYQAFRQENPRHPFELTKKVATQPAPPASPEPVQPTVDEPLEVEIQQDHRSSGDNVAGDKQVINHYYTTPAQSEPQPASPPLPGESFTFTTASVTPNGVVTKFQGEGRRRIFDLGGTPLEMVWVPPGDFLMGSPEGEGNDNEKPQHRVTFAEGFWMGRYPVTQAQWRYGASLKAVNRDLKSNPSEFKGENRPVEQVSWKDAQEFCDRLSQDQSQPFKLPSEAQWEYACRAGTTTPFAFGETLTTALANYDGKYTYGNGPKGKNRKKTTAVGQFPANSWGLHDMHGTVWEWCEDTWHPNYDGAPMDESSWIENKSTSQLLRGGSWYFSPRSCRSAFRSHRRFDNFDHLRGFRLALFRPRL